MLNINNMLIADELVFFILMTVDLATYIGLIEYYLVRKWKKFQ